MDDYQRNYVWGRLECDNFYRCIKMTAHKRNNCSDPDKKYIHYLGELKFVQVDSSAKGNRYSVVDGQQRLTTGVLFLIALRDTFPEKKFVDDINRCLVCGTDPKIDTLRFKLKEVFSDNSVLERLIRGRKLRSLTVSHVMENYHYFCSILKSEFSKDDLLFNQTNITVDDLFYEGIKQMKLTHILLEPDVNPGENPQWTFENSNSMGKPLSFSDLVCNLLISGRETVNERKLCYADEWLPMARSMGEDMDAFVRDFMQIKGNKKMPSAEAKNTSALFHEFKTMFGFTWDANEDTCKRIIADMVEYSIPYLSVVKGEYNQEYNKNDKAMAMIIKLLEDIRPFGLSRMTTFLTKSLYLYLNEDMGDQQLIGILRAIKTYKLRCTLVRSNRSETQHLQFKLLELLPTLQKSNDTEILTLETLFTGSSFVQYPNNETIYRTIETDNFYKKANVKHLLIMLEETLSKNRLDYNDPALQIEHIMPQTLTDEWISSLKKEGKNPMKIHQNYVHTLGNLTLIRHNQELGQKSFAEKQKLFDESAGLAIARKGTKNCQSWGECEIIARTKELAKVFLEQMAPLPQKLQTPPSQTVTSKTRPDDTSKQMLLDLFALDA